LLASGLFSLVAANGRKWPVATFWRQLDRDHYDNVRLNAGIIVAVAQFNSDQDPDPSRAWDRPAHRIDFESLAAKPQRWRDFFTAGPKRNVALDAEIASKVGKINPAGYRDTYAASVARLPHNPYVVLLSALGLIAVAVWFFFALEGRAFLVALLMAVFIGIVGLLVTVFTVRRIPAWHQARRIAVAYIAEHGGEMPKELRTWN
jgi:hypothetical protein